MRVKGFLFLFILATSCSTTQPGIKKSESHHLGEDSHTKLSEKISPLLQEHPGKNGFITLMNGEDALAYRLNAVKEAQRSLDLQYYIWHGDLTGKLLLKYVLEAAHRGVRVRMLFDNLNESRYHTEFKMMAQYPNIEVRLVNPDWKFFNHRMHNKALIVDNQVAIMGGRNIGDEYFAASERINFGDADVLLIGKVVNEISDEFDLYWNGTRSFPIDEIHKNKIEVREYQKAYDKVKKAEEEILHSQYAQALENKKTSNLNFYWGDVRFVYDPPEKLEGKNKNNAISQLRPELDKIQNELILVNPYFIPGRHGMKTLKKLRDRGVRIIILTNSLASNDVPSVFGGYKRYREDLLKNGIELYEVRSKNKKHKHKGFTGSSGLLGLHGKVAIADRQKMMIGSMNLDPRSRDINTEMSVVLDNPELAQKSAENLLHEMSDLAYKVELKGNELRWIKKDGDIVKTLHKEPDSTWWQRTKVWFSSIFVPEEML